MTPIQGIVPREESLAFRPCEFRRFDAQWLCDAAGVPLSEIVEPGERPEDAYARCHIPGAPPVGHSAERR